MVQEPSPAVYPVQQPDQPSHMPPQSHLMQQPMVAQTPQYMAQGMPTQMHPMLAQQHYLQQQQMLQQQHHQHHMHQQHMAMQSNQMGLAPNQMAQQQQQQMAMHQMWTAQQQQQQQQPQPQPAQMVQRPMQPDAGANGHRDRGRSGSAGPAAVRKDRMRQSKPLIDTCATVKDARDIFRCVAPTPRLNVRTGSDQRATYDPVRLCTALPHHSRRQLLTDDSFRTPGCAWFVGGCGWFALGRTLAHWH
jgi:hypothetical protein